MEKLDELSLKLLVYRLLNIFEGNLSKILAPRDIKHLMLVLSGAKKGTWVTLEASWLNRSALNNVELIKQPLKVPEEYVKEFEEFIKEAKLSYEKSKKISIAHKNNKRIECENVHYYVGFSNSKKLSDKELGEKLGYPKCCVEKWEKKKRLTNHSLFLWALLEKSGVKIPENLLLLSHIPCKYPYCKASLKLAKEYENLIKKFMGGYEYKSIIELERKRMKNSLKEAKSILKKHINNSKDELMKLKDSFEKKAFKKLIKYLEKEGLIN